MYASGPVQQLFASGTGEEEGGAWETASTSPWLPRAPVGIVAYLETLGCSLGLSGLISWGPDKRRHNRTSVQEVSVRVEKQVAASQHIPSLALIAPQRSRVQMPLPEKLVLS